MHNFLQQHSAYELIPESGKVVLLDLDFPVRQAFHALYEQSLASAPLWDSSNGQLVGMISASDFIAALQKLRHVVGATDSELHGQLQVAGGFLALVPECGNVGDVC